MTDFDLSHLDRLLSAERHGRQDAAAILHAIGVAPNVELADIGCGPGFFSLPAAKAIGPAGKVYAIDHAPKMLEVLRVRAAEAGVTNIECIIASDGGLPLRDGALDIVLLADVLHEVPGRAILLREIARVLRPGGTLAVIEWLNEEMEVGPALAKRLSYEEVAAATHSVGYQELTIPFAAGLHHYGLMARRN